MSRPENQPQSVARTSTFRPTRPILLAPKVPESERQRLWKGLERFVNCGDDAVDYQALHRGFPKFWPVRVLSWLRVGSKLDFELKYLDWDPACHSLFRFYRDTLRSVWRDDLTPENWGQTEFLLGLKRWEKDAIGNEYIIPGLRDAWREISKYSQSRPDDGPQIVMFWENGSFFIEPKNEFQQAFYLLFLDSWRARVCPRCGTYFVARRPKQKFCGTACSAGSRLASNRKWWARIGAKRRAEQARAKSQGNRRRRRSP